MLAGLLTDWITSTFLNTYYFHHTIVSSSLPFRFLYRTVGIATSLGLSRQCIERDCSVHRRQKVELVPCTGDVHQQPILYQMLFSDACMHLCMNKRYLQCWSLGPNSDITLCKLGMWNKHWRTEFMKHVLPRFSRPAAIGQSAMLKQMHEFPAKKYMWYNHWSSLLGGNPV